ncbi:ABC transporter substrate-binding protein [Candidatus Bipolaricaulota bacterium]|nr:ABC transporter substrate-binding protein [Candidatus Bipolaricaulota bacterium]
MKKSYRSISTLLVVALSMSLLLVGSVHADEGLKPSGKPVELGAIYPLTGAGQLEGSEMEKATKIAIDEINQAGGVLGRPLKVIFEDNETRPKAAVNAAHKLVNVDNVPVVLGSYSSGNSLPIGEYLNKKEIVQISLSTSPAMRDLGPWTFDVCGLDEMMGLRTAEFAMEDTGQKKFAILVMNNPYGIGIAKWNRKAIEKAGGEVVTEVRYTRGKTDYRSELQKLFSEDPPAVIYTAYGKEAKLIRKQAYELNLEPKYGWYASWFTLSTSAAVPETVVGTKGMVGVYRGGSAESFNEKFKERYGHLPKTCWGHYAYDWTMMAAMAINFSNSTDPNQIRQALPKIDHMYRGVSGGGDKRFDKDGMQVKESYQKMVYTEDGAQLVKSFEPKIEVDVGIPKDYIE